MNFFQRAAQNLPLTPAERAFLKLFQNWLLTALGVAITAGAQYALGNQQINVQALIYLVCGAFGLSILSALNKYWSAMGDTPLVLATQAAEQRVQQAVQAVTTPAQQPPVQQVPFPPAQPIPFPARPQLGTANLADVPPAESDTTRHFGDTGIIPTV